MGAYVARRLALMVPTLFGILLINFVLTQFLPGGPIEQIVAQLEEQTSATDRISGGGSEVGGAGGESEYRGAQGLPPDFIADLERQFGFDKPPLERFLLMLGNYLTFDFGESYFRSIGVIDLIIEKAAGLDLARPVVHAPRLRYLHPARHPQGGARRLALRHRHQRRGDRGLRHPGLSFRHHAAGALSRAGLTGRSSRCAASPPTTSRS
jgi:hypothetical protein